MKVITAITITVLSSQQHYHLKLFPLPCSHSGVLPITETCPAHLVWPARHVLKEVLCRREIWSEFGKEGKHQNNWARAGWESRNWCPHKEIPVHTGHGLDSHLQGRCPHLPATGLDKIVIQPATNYQPCNKDCPLFFMPNPDLTLWATLNNTHTHQSADSSLTCWLLWSWILSRPAPGHSTIQRKHPLLGKLCYYCDRWVHLEPSSLIFPWYL